MNRRTTVLHLVVAAVLAAAGCDDQGHGERLARMAEQSTREQSTQNQRVSRAHASLAEGSKQLVEADADARRDLTQLQDKLRQDQADVGQQRDALEAERKTIASERRQESMCSASLLMLGIVLACLAPLVLAGIALVVLNGGATQHEVSEVLVEELAQALGQDAAEASIRVPVSPPESRRLPSPEQR